MKSITTFKTLFAITIVTSLAFLTYSGSIYFDAYIYTRTISISVHAFNVTSQNSNRTIVETVFLLQNPTKIELKVAYVKQEIYRDSRRKVLLGETHLSGWQMPSQKYVIQVPPFSNGTVTVSTLLEDFSLESSDSDLFLTVYMRVEDIPLIESSTLKRYFVLSS